MPKPSRQARLVHRRTRRAPPRHRPLAVTFAARPSTTPLRDLPWSSKRGETSSPHCSGAAELRLPRALPSREPSRPSYREPRSLRSSFLRSWRRSSSRAEMRSMPFKSARTRFSACSNCCIVRGRSTILPSSSRISTRVPFLIPYFFRSTEGMTICPLELALVCIVLLLYYILLERGCKTFAKEGLTTDPGLGILYLHLY